MNSSKNRIVDVTDMNVGNIYKECELEENSTCKNYLQVQTEGNRTNMEGQE